MSKKFFVVIVAVLGFGGCYDGDEFPNVTFDPAEPEPGTNVVVNIDDNGTEFEDKGGGCPTCPSECSCNADCPTGYECTDGTCVKKAVSPDPECKVAGDCAAHEVCEGGKCVPECSADSDCDDGYMCDDDGVCVPEPECYGDSDCEKGEACGENGECYELLAEYIYLSAVCEEPYFSVWTPACGSDPNTQCPLVDSGDSIKISVAGMCMSEDPAVALNAVSEDGIYDHGNLCTITAVDEYGREINLIIDVEFYPSEGEKLDLPPELWQGKVRVIADDPLVQCPQ